MPKSVDITGKKFNHLKALKFVEVRLCGVRVRTRLEYWLFRCDCGNEKVIRKSSVIFGTTKGCGCLPSKPNLPIYLSVWTGNKYRLAHRVIMETYLGRPLTSKEVVHHKNENKHDNRIENLQIMTLSEHAKHHQENGLKTRYKQKWFFPKKRLFYLYAQRRLNLMQISKISGIPHFALCRLRIKYGIQRPNIFCKRCNLEVSKSSKGYCHPCAVYVCNKIRRLSKKHSPV